MIANSQMLIQSGADALEKKITEVRTLLDRLASAVVTARQKTHARACQSFRQYREASNIERY